jgi:hypothetical protein
MGTTGQPWRRPNLSRPETYPTRSAWTARRCAARESSSITITAIAPGTNAYSVSTQTQSEVLTTLLQPEQTRDSLRCKRSRYSVVTGFRSIDLSASPHSVLLPLSRLLIAYALECVTSSAMLAGHWDTRGRLYSSSSFQQTWTSTCNGPGSCVPAARSVP